MKKDKLYFGILLLILLQVIVWASSNMLYVRKSEESHCVSVIVDNSNSDRWISLRQGLEQAAEDNNIDLNYVFTGPLLEAKEQIELINLEIENGAEGVVVQMVSSSEYLDDIADISTKATLMLLETDVNPEDVYTFTGPNNFEIGRAVAKAVRDEYGAALKGKRIGILCGNQKQLSMQQRLQGLEEVLLQEDVHILWRQGSMNDSFSQKLQHMIDDAQVDIIIALENDETEKVVDYIQKADSESHECALYGVGCSEKVVYYLDKGIINTLVVTNEFAMGYQSIEAIANQLREHLTEMENSIINHFVVNKENLYDEENQKVLFPIVQ